MSMQNLARFYLVQLNIWPCVIVSNTLLLKLNKYMQYATRLWVRVQLQHQCSIWV